MKKQTTIRDVAALAGVSLATVSRALNDPDYPMSTALRQKVREAAAELEYVPNMAARSLRRDMGRDIGIVIPNVSNPFYLQTLLGIDDVLSKNKYSMILCSSMRDPEQEKRYLKELYERQVKGIILSSVDDNAEAVREYIRKGMKFVLLDQHIAGIDCPGINFDSRAGARAAVEYLVSQGHEKIAFATMPLTRWTRTQMYKGYQDGLQAAGLTQDEKLFYVCSLQQRDTSGDLELAVGCNISEKFLKDGCPATAIMCINDMIAFGIIKTLVKGGVRVPEDVSVIGFDDVPFAETFLPALTTVRCPSVETGRLAALMLLDTISSGSSDMTLSMNLAPRLMVRDTVMKRERLI